MSGEQLKEVLVVEGKTFIVSWNRSNGKRETLAITEKRRNRNFFGVFSSDGGNWVGKVLCQMSMGLTKVGTMFRFNEINGSINAILKENQRGKYLQITIHSHSNPKNFPTLCFPEGLNGKGWEFLGVKIRTLLDTRPGTKRVYQPVAEKMNQSLNLSFAEVCKGKKVMEGGERRNLVSNSIKEIKVVSHELQKWEMVVICKASGTNPDWVWCEERVKQIFQSATFTFPKNDEALISLSSSLEVEKLLTMPPLESWNGVFMFMFRKWFPEAGSDFSLQRNQGGRRLRINIQGLPYHLRNQMVMEILANSWGDYGIMDFRNGLDRNEQCGFVINGGDVMRIPRSVIVADERCHFPVDVDVQISELIGEEGRSWSMGVRQGPPERNLLTDNLVKENLLVTAEETRCSTSTNPGVPPGFEKCGTSAQPFFRTHNPARIDIHGDRLAYENRFAILEGENVQVMDDDAHIDRPIMSLGPSKSMDVVDEQIEPVGFYARRRRNKSKSIKRGPIPLGFGPRYQLLREGLAKLGSRRGRSRTREGARSEAQCQSAPTSLPYELLSSFTEVSKVNETQSVGTEEVFKENRNTDLIKEVAVSLSRYSTEGDLRNLINWVVLPLAEDLGLSSTLGRMGREKLFLDLASQENKGKQDQNLEEGEINGAVEIAVDETHGLPQVS
ncbi:hypothetical protein FRX31_025043 [Thalictrum thalictroides]|uniref:DUF4283 domain-containing protein n=1 Tax=Thalictrum thalictroides TaxID=46969 RepID=A0A7J6VKT6_THATH|nr:hypothetical protein FRX31_025043 [Thalictrum thalictroides]